MYTNEIPPPAVNRQSPFAKNMAAETQTTPDRNRVENIVVTETKTKDGYTITTIEQAGIYKGQAIGRVLMLRGDKDEYDYWTIGSVAGAGEAAKQAPKMTRMEFTDYMDRLKSYREIISAVVI